MFWIRVTFSEERGVFTGDTVIGFYVVGLVVLCLGVVWESRYWVRVSCILGNGELWEVFEGIERVLGRIKIIYKV